MSRRRVNKILAKALDSPDFRRAYLQFSAEKAARPVRPCGCVVLEIPGAAKDQEFELLTPGTITAFVGREGEPLLGNLTGAVADGDSAAFNRATEQIHQMMAGLSREIARTRSDPSSRARTVPSSQRQAFPSIAEINYANKALVSHVYAGEVLRVNMHAFVYNGGHLDPRAFSMNEYHQPDSRTPLACVLVVRQPKLSEIEREALRLVPSGSSANNVGSALVEPVTPALVAFVAAATEAAARFVYNEFVNWFVGILHGGTTTALASISDAVLNSEEFQTILRSLPPEVTAAELVRLRTDMLLQAPQLK